MIDKISEKKWYDNIPKEGILCWVWDNIKMKHTYAEKVVKYIDGEYPYITEIDNQFIYAEPIKPEECHATMKKTILTEKEATDFKVGDWVSTINAFNNLVYQIKDISELDLCNDYIVYEGPHNKSCYKSELRLATSEEIYRASINSCKSKKKNKMKTQREIYQELLQLSKRWEIQYKTNKDKTNRIANIYAVLNTVKTWRRQYGNKKDNK